MPAARRHPVASKIRVLPGTDVMNGAYLSLIHLWHGPREGGEERSTGAMTALGLAMRGPIPPLPPYPPAPRPRSVFPSSRQPGNSKPELSTVPAEGAELVHCETLRGLRRPVLRVPVERNASANALLLVVRSQGRARRRGQGGVGFPTFKMIEGSARLRDCLSGGGRPATPGCCPLAAIDPRCRLELAPDVAAAVSLCRRVCVLRAVGDAGGAAYGGAWPSVDGSARAGGAAHGTRHAPPRGTSCW